MCVAIYKPASEVITKKVFQKCFKANGDGAGFAYVEHTTQNPVIVKGLFSFKEFWHAFRAHMDKETIIHFRWATHGANDPQGMKDNCHPFPIPQGAMIHNGVISWASPTAGDSRSDTRIFTEELLVPFINEGIDIHSQAVKTCIEEAIGSSNKIVMLYKGKPIILNEQQGTWIDGVWFSNVSWQWDFKYTYLDTLSSSSYRTSQDLTSTRSSRWDDDDWYRNLEMQWEKDERREALYKHAYMEECCDEDSEEDIDTVELPVCDICQKEVFSLSQLVTINGSTSACIECWNSVGSWQTEIDAFDRLHKPYMRMV